MKFSSMLARKYIFAQKRHSMLTILSIAAAVALITVVFTVFSTYWTCRKNIAAYDDPWHATIVGLSKDEIRELAEKDYIEHYRFTESNTGMTDENGKAVKYCEAKLMFTKNAYDPNFWLPADIEKMGYKTTDFWDYSDPGLIGVNINSELLQYELIGLDAKFAAIQIVALLYVFILFLIICARFVIDTAFEISSKEREKQFGVLRSIGASKKQIVRILLCEGGYLSIAGVPLGLLFGTGIGYIIYRLVLSSGVIKNFTEVEEIADKVVTFSVSPILLALTAVTGLVWALLSAYGTGMRSAKMSPIEAMRSRGTVIKKVKRRSFVGLLFGWSGKLASRNIRRSKKRFIITVLSVMLSITLFVTFSFVVGVVRAFMEADMDVYYTLYSDMNVEVYEAESLPPYDPDYVKPEKCDYKQIEKKLKDSGYFKNIRPVLNVWGEIYDEDDAFFGESMDIFFVNEETYNKMMGGSPEISYSRLAEENGFILLKKDENNNSMFGVRDIPDPFIIKMRKWGFLDEPIEEVNELTGETYMTDRDIKTEYMEEINILKVYDEYDPNFVALGNYYYGSTLIATEEQFKDWEEYSMCLYYTSFNLDLADGTSYSQVKNYFRNNGYKVFMDLYGERLKVQRTVSAITIFGYALNALIAVIAIINMVNIISTGIINRRAEIAAMKSLGMNKFQLNKMLLLECFGYVSLSGVISAILGIAMFFGTAVFVSRIGFWEYDKVWELLDHGRSLLAIPLLMLAAFAVGTVATAIPLRSINKTPITESMRMVD